jgi:hypothetical protein
MAATTADITPRILTITATGIDKVYDGSAAATVTLSDDRVPGDDLTTSYASASFASADAGVARVVSVTGIGLTGSDAGNYTFNTTAMATADITPRPLTIAADPKSKFFGQPDPALTYQHTAGTFVGGDGFSGTLTRVSGEAVGSYAILQGSVSAGPNYAITYDGANLTIGGWTALGFHAPIGIPNSIFQAPAAALGELAAAPMATGSTIWNTSKGGSTIPLKFNVYAGSVELTDVPTTVKAFTAMKLSTCSGGAGDEAVEELASAGSTTLRYADGQFIQNWKTSKVNTDTCYRVQLQLMDNSAIYTFVKLKK